MVTAQALIVPIQNTSKNDKIYVHPGHNDSAILELYAKLNMTQCLRMAHQYLILMTHDLMFWLCHLGSTGRGPGMLLFFQLF